MLVDIIPIYSLSCGKWVLKKFAASTHPELTCAKVSHLTFLVQCCDCEFLNMEISAQVKGSAIREIFTMGK